MGLTRKCHIDISFGAAFSELGTKLGVRRADATGTKPMLTLLERHIATIQDRLVILAPSSCEVPDYFQSVSSDPQRHRQLVRDIQRLRGNIYFQDGALSREQRSQEGLHSTPEDERSWHLLMLNKRRQVSACIWYLEHDPPVSVNDLRVRSCPLVKDLKVRRAVESDLR